MSIRLFTVLVAAATLFALPPTASAQFLGDPMDVTATGTAYRVFASPGEPVIRVHVLGDVGGGLYAIGERTTLTELLALAGGAPLSEPGWQTRRTVTVRLYRPVGATRELVYESELHNMLREPGQHPSLEEGDVLTVESQLRRRIDLFHGLQIVSSLASVVLLSLRLVDAF